MRFSFPMVILWLFGSVFLAGQVEAQPTAVLPALESEQADGETYQMPAPSLWDLIGNPSVQADLDLVTDQQKQIDDLRQQMTREVKQLFSQPETSKDYAEFSKQVESLKQQYLDRVKEVLLPLQVERMKQIALQMHLKRSGTANAITSPAVAELLGLSDQQVDRLKQQSVLLKKKLAEDIKKLKAKLEQTLLNELTAQQRAKLSELKGDKWASKPEDWSRRLEEIRRQQDSGNN